MSKKSEETTLRALTYWDLQSEVSIYISQGWEPFGGTFVIRENGIIYYCTTMLRERNNENNN